MGVTACSIPAASCAAPASTSTAATAQQLTDQAGPTVAAGAALKQISGQFKFAEGPAADAQGNVYFTDQPNNSIWVYRNNGTLELFMKPAGRANGLYFDQQGHLLAAADEYDQLWSIAPNRQVSVLLDNIDGRRMNGPNDIWIAPNGGIYFTDPYYQRDYWQRQKADLPTQDVYYIAPGSDEPHRVINDMVKPNGLIGSPDGHTLYVSDFGGERTWRYAIDDNGQLSDKTLFANMGSDGMALDMQGNVYMTNHGVTVFNPDGQQIGHIEVPEEWTGNVTFGGTDRKTLFITASKSLYTIRMAVVGAPPVSARVGPTAVQTSGPS